LLSTVQDAPSHSLWQNKASQFCTKAKRSLRCNKRKIKACSMKETSFVENRINTIVPVYTNPKEAAWRIIELDLTNLEP
jgi:hypothetical protein